MGLSTASGRAVGSLGHWRTHHSAGRRQRNPWTAHRPIGTVLSDFPLRLSLTRKLFLPSQGTYLLLTQIHTHTNYNFQKRNSADVRSTTVVVTLELSLVKDRNGSALPPLVTVHTPPPIDAGLISQELCRSRTGICHVDWCYILWLCCSSVARQNVDA